MTQRLPFHSVGSSGGAAPKLQHTADCGRAKTLPLGVADRDDTPERLCVNILVAARGSHTSQGQWGTACGVVQQKVSAWEDPESPIWPTLPRLIRAAFGPQRQVVASICRSVLALTEQEPRSMRSPTEHVCTATAAMGVVAQEVVTANADGHWTDSEATENVRAIDKLIAALQQLRRAILDAAAKEGK